MDISFLILQSVALLETDRWAKQLAMKDDRELFKPLGPAIQPLGTKEAPKPTHIVPGVVEIGGKWETVLPTPAPRMP